MVKWHEFSPTDFEYDFDRDKLHEHHVTFEEAVEILNGTCFGLSSSIYTSNVQRAFQAIRDFDAGITYINGPTIGAEVHLPFGGVKDSGFGDRECGTAAFDFFSELKVVYVGY